MTRTRTRTRYRRFIRRRYHLTAMTHLYRIMDLSDAGSDGTQSDWRYLLTV